MININPCICNATGGRYLQIVKYLQYYVYYVILRLGLGLGLRKGIELGMKSR